MASELVSASGLASASPPSAHSGLIAEIAVQLVMLTRGANSAAAKAVLGDAPPSSFAFVRVS